MDRGHDRTLGTEGAGDLLSAPALRKSLPANFRSKRNVQIVLKCAIDNGVIGPPQVLAVYLW